MQKLENVHISDLFARTAGAIITESIRLRPDPNERPCHVHVYQYIHGFHGYLIQPKELIIRSCDKII